MGDTSTIQWTNRTWNPWQGCAKVSPECDQCYMFRDKIRYGQDPEKVVRSKPPTFNKPLAWEREAAAANRSDLVFTCSWSDWFIRDADVWRAEAWTIVRRTRHLTYQILTKRHGRIAANLPSDWGNGYPNVWLGVSAGDQRTWDARTKALRDIPARIRFVSLEPMLAPVDVSDAARWLDWIVVGGESGGLNARPIDERWIRAVIDSCRGTGCRVFVKQMGSAWARRNKARDSHGGDMAEWAVDLRVREFPRAAVAS